MTPVINSKEYQKKFIKIPCGHCLGCRLQYSKKWSERLMAEKETSSSALFLTLTYNNEILNKNCLRIVQNKDFGDVSLGYSLNKDDLVLFWKRLRKYFPDSRIRYFACGEYGSENFRPHYHAIVFNLPVDQLNLTLYKQVRGNSYFNSDVLEKIWKNGFVVVGDFSQASAAYVARYCLKKANNNIDWKSLYVDLDITPEFVSMSRKPGLGYDWFSNHEKDFLEFQKKYIASVDGSKEIGLNRFWLSKLEEKYPEEVKLLKDKRMMVAQNLLDTELLGTDLEELEYLVVCEDNLNKKIKSLRREL